MLAAAVCSWPAESSSPARASYRSVLELGFDSDEVTVALDEHRYRPRVQDDVASAKEAGVHGTPTFFLNGQRLEGHWRNLASAVPEALEQARGA